jgi:hypothetical protein
MKEHHSNRTRKLTSLRVHHYLLLLSFVCMALCGCGGSSSAVVSGVGSNPKPNGPGLLFSGKAMDGQQPIMGARVYLFAANTTGYGAASVPLLVAAGTGYTDSLGGYTLTAQDGSFNIPGGYTCKSTDQLYVYVLGGNAGVGVNSAIGELAALGGCPLTTQTTPSLVWVNEVTTIAAAYAIAGFATDATHVASSGTALAITDIANAFGAAANLAVPSTGAAQSVIPSGNASVPQSEIDTLANILAACIHSAGPSSSGCTTLFTNATSGSIAPTDTATAAINIAHSPANNAAALYALQTSSSPFSPSLTAAPNDFSIALNFTTFVSGGTNGIAIDASGNVWMTNGLYSLITLSNLGELISGTNGYTDGLYGPGFLAIDPSGNVWVGQYETILGPPGPYSLFEFSSSGQLLSGANGFTGGGLDRDRPFAIDASGNVWVGNAAGTTLAGSVSEFSNAGVPLSSSTGFVAGGMKEPFNIAIDVSGNAWVTNFDNNAVVEFASDGSVLSGASGFTDGSPANAASGGIGIDSTGNVWVNYASGLVTLTNHVTKYSSSGQVLSIYTDSGIGNGDSLTIDGAGNVWIPNYHGDSITELSNSGVVLSGPNGYVSSELYGPYTIVTDGSGNVWVSSGDHIGSCNLVEYIGIAVPVVTPLSVGVKEHMLGTRP